MNSGTGVSFIAPMTAMAALIFSVLFWLLLTRIFYIREGKVRLSYFRVYPATEPVAPLMAQAARSLTNLFEMPVLFFVACLTFMVTNRGTADDLNLAWGYVALRIVHTLIHLSYNNVKHRLFVYTLSSVALGVFWLRLACGHG